MTADAAAWSTCTDRKSRSSSSRGSFKGGGRRGQFSEAIRK